MDESLIKKVLFELLHDLSMFSRSPSPPPAFTGPLPKMKSLFHYFNAKSGAAKKAAAEEEEKKASEVKVVVSTPEEPLPTPDLKEKEATSHPEESPSVLKVVENLPEVKASNDDESKA